jgi:Zn-dependent protease
VLGILSTMLLDLTTGDLVIVAISLIISLALHEAMHAFTARWLGDTTAEDAGRLTLNPLRHIDPLTTILLPIVSLWLFNTPFLAAKPVPFNPSRVRYGEMGAALVGIAGPITNLVLAIIAAIFMRFLSLPAFSVLGIFMAVNVGIFVFNMIPFPPLDGSRLLYAFAPEPLQELMNRIEAMGFTAILIFMVLFFYLLAPLFENIDNAIYSFLLR